MSPAGVVLVDKATGWTSHDVVARIRRLAGTKKVGHAGTLDPMATGVLVVGVGRATRLLGHLTLAGKEYTATARLGESTSTDDAEGEVLATAPTSTLTEQVVRAAARSLVGEISQVPPAVSAVKVAGRRAYQRVRAGETPTLPTRDVTVYEMGVHDIRRVRHVVDVDLTVRCSSGTYVRALARDLGTALGTGGHLTALRRTAVGPFTLEAARDLDTLAEDLAVLPIADVARTVFPARTVTESEARDVRHGRMLPLPISELVAVFAPDGEFLGLYEPRNGAAHPRAVFV